MNYRAIRGTKDVLPGEAALWRKIEEASREVFRRYGYGEIRTPIIEETGLFVKTVGEDTDIVKKEMFSFVDRGEREITLRPEGTASVVRAYLESNLAKTDPFQKWYYLGPMFRAERPQAGRLRQFHQIGVEALGVNHPALDAEVMRLLTALLDAYGVGGYQLAVNNLGCRDDKKRLSGALRELFGAHGIHERLCDDCKRRASTNPLRVLDCKNEACRAVVREHFKSVDFICPDCKAHFDAVLGFLTELRVPHAVNPLIVRGLDYYTRTVFEVTHGELGSQNAIGAGGRYDNLIADMGGPSLGACGFALGLERVVMALAVAGGNGGAPGADLCIATLGDAAYRKAFALADELRRAGVSCELDYERRSLKSQMRGADKTGTKYVLIIGDDELARGEAVLRNMTTKEQAAVRFDDAAAQIAQTLKRNA